MIIKLNTYKKFKFRFKQGILGKEFGLAFINYFGLKSQDLGDIRLDLTVLRVLSNKEAKKRIEFQLIDWTRKV